MDPNMLKQQQRLARVSKHQWREALNGLTRHLTKKLNAKLLTGEAARSAGGSPDGMLVGGREFRVESCQLPYEKSAN